MSDHAKTGSSTSQPHRTEEQIFTIALHDVRRMIETMGADARLVMRISQRLTQAIEEAYWERTRRTT